MSLHPIFKVQVGSSSSLELAGTEIIDIAIRTSMDSAPGHFESTVKLGEKAGDFAGEEKVIVSLGYLKNGSKDLTVVFTGKVESISNTGPKVMVVSPLTKLYNLKIDRSYEKQYAGDIVKDLAASVQIEVDDISDGIKFPSYTVSRSKSAFEQISDLAKLCGFDFYANSSGKLVFKEYDASASTAHTIEYGKHILEIQLVDQKPAVDSVKVAGSSPAGTKGEDKHYWMTKKNVEDEAGSGGGGGSTANSVLIQNMALKDPVTAKAAAQAMLKRLRATTNINLKILGNEKVMLGDTIKIQNVPQKSLNGEFQVRELEHILTKTEGFTTTLTCRGASQ